VSKPSGVDVGKKRLMLVIPNISSYHSFLSELALELDRWQYEVHVATSAKALAGGQRKVTAVRLHEIEFARGADVIDHYKASKRLDALVRLIEPDLIHVHFSACVLCAALARRDWWPRTIGTIHGGIFPQVGRSASYFFKKLEHWCYRRMDLVWMLNESDRKAYSLLENMENKVLCYRSYGLGCCVEKFLPPNKASDKSMMTKRECGFTSTNIIFIFIGRHVNFKGFGVSVKAFFEVYRGNENARLLAVGDFDRLHASGLSVSETATFDRHPGISKIGWTDDVAKYLAIADICVFPSTREGVPVNLMEALAMGVPVITLNTRGCGEVVTDGVDGVVLKSPDGREWRDIGSGEKIAAVGSAMLRLAGDEGLRRTMSENAKRRRTSFDRGVWIAEQIEIYNRLTQVRGLKFKHTSKVGAMSIASSSGKQMPDTFRRPKLLYFVTEDYYFCSHRLSLALAAQRAGYEVLVVTRVRDHGEQIRSAGLNLIPFEISRTGINPLVEIYTLVRLMALFRREKPELVHNVAVKPVLYGTIAAYLSGSPFILNAIAGMGWLFASANSRANWIKPVARWAFVRMLRFGVGLVQNPDDVKTLDRMGLSPAKIRLIQGSGVDLQEFRPHPEPAGRPTVVLSSRLIWEKGVGEFVAAARLLRARGVVARFVLAGGPDTSRRSAIPESQLIQWAAEGIVELLGWVSDVPRLLAECHLVCLPSYYGEGIPKSLIEAAAAGRPIVTTDMPGCREIVHHGDNGLLVPPRNAEALAEAMELLLADPGLRRRMGARGRSRVEQEFGLDSIIKQTLAVYAEVKLDRPLAFNPNQADGQ
jgi:glycosyltransferase involved in cell wall biosynthesis